MDIIRYPLTVIRASFLLAATLVLLIGLIKPLGSRFVAYGPRSAVSSSSTIREKEVHLKSKHSSQSLPFKALDQAARIQVPHSWFTTFYVLSVFLSIAWGIQIWTKGSIFLAIADHASLSTGQSSSMTVQQVKLCWCLMLLQGCRRLFECLAFYKPSTSQMWVGHWLLGLFFYIGTSVSVWVEGSYALKQHDFVLLTESVLQAPSFRSFISILLFLMASGVQHDCHTYLASLKSPPSSISGSTSQVSSQTDAYKIPTHPAFNQLVTPHYFCECLIYLSLTIAAAPDGQWINWTLASAFTFVLVNLGVTAVGTRAWYIARFGTASVQGKYSMIPLVF